MIAVSPSRAIRRNRLTWRRLAGETSRLLPTSRGKSPLLDLPVSPRSFRGLVVTPELASSRVLERAVIGAISARVDIVDNSTTMNCPVQSSRQPRQFSYPICRYAGSSFARQTPQAAGALPLRMWRHGNSVATDSGLRPTLAVWPSRTRGAEKHHAQVLHFQQHTTV